jgi:hypothetical protein
MVDFGTDAWPVNPMAIVAPTGPRFVEESPPSTEILQIQATLSDWMPKAWRKLVGFDNHAVVRPVDFREMLRARPGDPVNTVQRCRNDGKETH